MRHPVKDVAGVGTPVTMADGSTLKFVRCTACGITFWDDGKVACPGCLLDSPDQRAEDDALLERLLAME